MVVVPRAYHLSIVVMLVIGHEQDVRTDPVYAAADGLQYPVATS